MNEPAAGAGRHGAGGAAQLKLLLCGDVMTGRGIDQILPYPAGPRLFEPYVSSALDYVALAERKHGSIPRPADFSYIWGDAVAEFERLRPDVRIVNLETSITLSDQAEAKGINYRMAPGNVPCLTALKIDCCALANNHILDWGRAGLLDTVQALRSSAISLAGAGADAAAAAAPAIIDRGPHGRIIVVAFGMTSSGIPATWAAAAASPGVNLLADLSEATVDEVAHSVRGIRRPNDVVVASIHWGGNWGYEIPSSHVAFARGLVRRAGVDLVHGHSSHHAKAFEVYEGRLILYGCGDFINDYEGIGGYEEFGADLVVGYLASLSRSGELRELELMPFRIGGFRLNRASAAEVAWLIGMFNRQGRRFGVRTRQSDEGTIVLPPI